MDDAVALVERWCRGQHLEGIKTEIFRLPGRTPLIYLDVPGN
ncbi:hypothetical protein [Nitrosococcus wardiae]|nr:hypothetical protein [Nitrosococcus wardiae]